MNGWLFASVACICATLLALVGIAALMQRAKDRPVPPTITDPDRENR